MDITSPPTSNARSRKIASDSTLHERLALRRPLLWLNPAFDSKLENWNVREVATARVVAVEARLKNFRPVLQALFPQLNGSAGVIDSPLVAAPGLAKAIGLSAANGKLMVKCDHTLPVGGSIKARGGIYAVLEHAETIAMQDGLLKPTDSYERLLNPRSQSLFRRRRLSVGSTGNLGLSVGIVAARLGFNTTVHMAVEAKAWKKQLLRSNGATVVEHQGDYELAVAAGRAASDADASSFFIDDERSSSLLYGYASAATSLARQLSSAAIRIDASHPLFVYLPCGVGGAPTGITLGLKLIFGANVHCFFAEPVESASFLLQLDAAMGDHPSVHDFGLTNHSVADGLVVPRGSVLAAETGKSLISGIYTVTDEQLLRDLFHAWTCEQMRLEPSAAAGISGPLHLLSDVAGQRYIEAHDLKAAMPSAVHVVWATGGLFVPEQDYTTWLDSGRALVGV